jgi:hypothetical protein
MARRTRISKLFVCCCFHNTDEGFLIRCVFYNLLSPLHYTNTDSSSQTFYCVYIRILLATVIFFSFLCYVYIIFRFFTQNPWLMTLYISKSEKLQLYFFNLFTSLPLDMLQNSLHWTPYWKKRKMNKRALVKMTIINATSFCCSNDVSMVSLVHRADCWDFYEYNNHVYNCNTRNIYSEITM